MENEVKETEVKETDNSWKELEKSHKRGKVFAGILVVVIGSLFLGRELGAQIPAWVLTWKTLLIGIGLLFGVKSKFKNFSWLVPVFVGGVFLISDLYPELAIKPLLWPIVVIFFGLVIIFKPHRGPEHFRNRMHRRRERQRRKERYRRHYEIHGYNKNSKHWQDFETEETVNSDRIEINTFLGGVKKNVISKNFKGGYVKNVLGGSEINLSQADFEGTAVLDISIIMGGAELTIPANWELQSELDSIMGSIQDQRPVHPSIPTDKTKVLILRGSVFMGGIDIKSY